PGAELFAAKASELETFACQRIPIYPGAVEPDRGYWRLLEEIFFRKNEALRRAVDLTATGNTEHPRDPADEEAARLLRQVPVAKYGKALRAHDRVEVEAYRALYALLRNYVRQRDPERPLSVAVFGPPGAGKGFGVKSVAEELSAQNPKRAIAEVAFNLSQY